jgi:hypothetical protein
VDLSLLQRERRHEERLLLLDRGEVRGRRRLAAYDPRQLLAVGVDEARLADAVRIEPLEVVEMACGIAQRAALAAHPVLTRPRLPQHAGEGGRVGGQQDVRRRPGEVAFERAAVLVGLRGERALDLCHVAIVLELGDADGGR